MRKPIYLDNHATTPVDPAVVQAMLPYLSECFGNIASTHCFGREARKAVDKARAQVAALIHGRPEEVIFTSGATESNNLAIKGYALANQHVGRHIITTAIEHKSVLDTCHCLESMGFAVTYLPVDRHGLVHPDQVRRAIMRGAPGTTERTVLISVMGANNEIGTIMPIEEIGAIAFDAGIMLHVDAVQAAGKFPVDVMAWNVGLMSLSAHKMYGPKGIGALYVRANDAAPKMTTQIHGGGQEGGIRSGTVPAHLVVGFGAAAELCVAELQSSHIERLRDRLWHGIQNAQIPCAVNGHPEQRLAGNLSVTFAQIDPEIIAISLRDIAVSSTSACSAGAAKVSYVLKAIGLSDAEAAATLRFGIGRFNTEDEIDYTVSKLQNMFSRFAKAETLSIPRFATKSKTLASDS